MWDTYLEAVWCRWWFWCGVWCGDFGNEDGLEDKDEDGDEDAIEDNRCERDMNFWDGLLSGELVMRI